MPSGVPVKPQRLFAMDFFDDAGFIIPGLEKKQITMCQVQMELLRWKSQRNKKPTEDPFYPDWPIRSALAVCIYDCSEVEGGVQ